MTAGATVQGSVGFGLNLLAAPLLVLIDARLVPGPVLVAAIALVAAMSWRERHAIDFSGLRWALLGRLAGTTAGTGVLAAASQRLLNSTIGAMVLTAVAISGFGLRLRPGPKTLVVAGALSGFMGTTASTGGPPMALVYQHAPGATVRATLSGHFLIGAPISLAGVWAAGRFGAAEAVMGVLLIPGTLLGLALARSVAPVLDRGFTRVAVLSVSGLAGALVIGRELVRYLAG